jgi:CDP-glucose 4,6-dehydratase
MNNKKNKTALITGATGALGGNLGLLLLSNGWNVVSYSIQESKFCLLNSKNAPKGTKFYQGDVLNLEKLTKIIKKHKPNAIINLAALSTIEACYRSPLEAIKTNSLGTATVLEAYRLSEIKSDIIICAESDKAYGSYNEDMLPYKEDYDLRPHGIYEASKSSTSFIAHAYRKEFSLPVTTIRTVNMYGPGDFNFSRLVVGTIVRALSGINPVLYSNARDYKREFLFLGDAVRMIFQLIESPEKSVGHVFNIGSGSTYKIADAIDEICQLANPKCKPVVVDRDQLVSEIKTQYVSMEKFKKTFPSFSFELETLNTGLRHTIPWYRKNIDAFKKVFRAK